MIAAPSTSAAGVGGGNGLPSLTPGVVLIGAGVLGAVLAHRLLPAVGVLTWAVVLGALVANLGTVPVSAGPGLRFATRRLLRVGIVLLGLSLPLAAIGGLGAPVLVLVVATLVTTLLGTIWLGHHLGVGSARTLLVATGVAICGASAIAAMEEHAEADEEDVAMAIAMVTLCGTAAMLALPLLQAPLGLTADQYGVWVGASVHEVGQVVAAASPVGAAAVAVAVVVKLTRVLMLAPIVAGVGTWRRRRRAAVRADTLNGTGDERGSVPPVLPLFVLGFLGCVLIRSAGLVPAAALPTIELAQTVALAAALFGLGTGVHLRSLAGGSGPVVLVSMVATVLIAGLGLAGTLVWV